MVSLNKQKGFTLVELLIVIVVIAILAAISIVAYNGVTNKARDDERVATARELINAAAAYNSEKDQWPTLTQLKSFDTVKLNGKAASDKVGATGPTEGNKEVIKYEPCGSPQSGVRVTFWKDIADNSFQKGANTLTTGKC